MSAEQQIYLGRQPILDAKQMTFGYELLFRSGQTAYANVVDDYLATTTVIINTLSELGIDNVLGKHMGFINVSAALLYSEILDLLPSHRIVLELLETVIVDEALITRCKELKAKGFTLAIDDYTQQDGYEHLYPLIDYIKFDIMLMNQAEIEATIASLSPWTHLKFLAEKVEDREQFEYYQKAKFALFQGYFFARPAVLTRKKLNPSESVLLRILNQIHSNAELSDIYLSFEQCPHLGIGLLRLVNSAGMGLRDKVSSLKQALALLGRKQLAQWVQILLYSQDGSIEESPLMEIATIRAKTMMLICTKYIDPVRIKADTAEQAFMTGMLSLIDVALGIEKVQLLEELNLGEDVSAAILQHKGFLGNMLILVENLETGNFQLINKILKHYNISSQDLQNAQLEAMQWVNGLGAANE